MKSNNKGFSLVEMIIVIAVIAILAGASVTFFGHVRYANTQKTVESIDSAIDKLQSNAMSKSNNSYLYIYKLSDGYYMKTVDTYYDTFATSVFDTNGKRVTGKTVYPSAYSYDLSKLDSYVNFHKLDAGRYTFEIIAANADSENNILVNKTFRVTE